MSSLADQYIAAMKCTFRSDKTQGVTITYRLQLTGDGGGNWRVQINDGECHIRPGAPRRADTTISMSTADYLKLAKGALNVTDAYQSGYLKVNGNLNNALNFVEYFPPWAAYLGKDCETDNEATPEESSPVADDNSDIPNEAISSVLQNGSFEEYQPFVYKGDTKVWKEDQFPEEYGKYWALDILKVGDSRLHMMKSGTFGRFTKKYFGGGIDYHQHGASAQVVISRYMFDIVLRQTVQTEPGKSYTFKGGLVTFRHGTGTGRQDNIIFFNIGIDPTGGTDPHSTQVIWRGRDGTNNIWVGKPYGDKTLEVKTTAQTDKITVFIRIENTEEDAGSAHLNYTYLEDFRLEQA